jgi:ankyrin repeat protein
VVAQLLIDNKADLLLKTDRDETALSLAKSAMVSTQRILEEKVKKHEEELAAAAREAAEAALAEEARILALGKLSKFGSMKSLDGSFVSKKSSSSATCEGLDKQQVDPVLDEKNRIDNYVKTIGVLRLGYIAMVRELQAKVTDASKNLLLENLLMLAIEEDWADLATAVLNTGTSPNHSFSIHQPGAHCLETRVLYGIQLAAMRGHASVMDVLINNRAMVHGVSDIDGNTPLMEVARTGTAECARLLINAGVDLEASGLQGTAAHVAVTHGNALVLKELVHAGARIGGKNADGQDCVLRSWILAHGSGSKGKSPATLSSAVSVLGVFRDLFGRLAKEGRGGACDPYCYVCLGRSATGPWWPSGVRSCKVSNSPNPQWNELLQLSPEGDSDVALSFVKIEVWDWDQVGDEVLIGTVIKDLSHVNSQPNSTVAGLFKITPPTPHSSPEHDSQPASPEGGSSPASRSKDVSAGRLSLKLQLLRTGSLCSLHVYLEFAEQLLVQERHGKTMSDCLKSAALAGWSDMIHTCVEVQGADPNSRLDGDRCRLPVMYAAATQQEKTVRALLDNKADPNLADAQGVSALMWACAGRVHFAANANFSADFEASLDRTERRLCQLRIEYAAADFVSDNMADIDPRIKWKGHESKEEHDRLLHETTINHRDVVFSRYQTVDTLLKHGADPSHRDQRGNDAACYLKPEMLLDTFFDLEWLWC